MRRALLFLTVSMAAGCQPPPEPPFPLDEELTTLRNLLPRLNPLPDPTNRFANDPRAKALGEQFFYDQAFGACPLSCASCHSPQRGFGGEAQFSDGCVKKTPRHSQSALNTASQPWFFWDGRADSQWMQAITPLTVPAGMTSNATIVRTRIQEQYLSEYVALTGVAPADEPDDKRVLSNFTKIVAAYERTLHKVGGRFNDDLSRFIQVSLTLDDAKIEADPAYLAFKTFARKGQCTTCHKGPDLTDSQFRVLGLQDATLDRGRATGIPQLLASPYNSKGPYSDCNTDQCEAVARLNALASANMEELEGAFKTPTLRGVALSAPYMHNGSLATLEDVVEFYNRGGDPDGTFAGIRTVTIKQLELTAQEKTALVELLKSMTDPSLVSP